MTEAADKYRARSGARRLGFAVAIVVNAAALYAINVWPGWQALPILTEDARQMLTVVNVSLIAGVLTNAINLVVDLPRVRAAGNIVSLAFGLAILVILSQSFPFVFPIGWDWSLVVRILIVLAMVGSITGLVVQLAALATGRFRPRR